MTDKSFQIQNPFCFSVTEILNFEDGNNKIIEPTLSWYSHGIALFDVDADFCKK